MLPTAGPVASVRQWSITRHILRRALAGVGLGFLLPSSPRVFLILGPVVMRQMRKIRGPVVPGTAEVLSLRRLSRPSRSKPTHTGRPLVQVKSYRRQPQSRRVSGCRRPEVVRPPRDDTSQPWQDSQHAGSHRRTALHTRGRAPLPELGVDCGSGRAASTHCSGAQPRYRPPTDVRGRPS